MNVTAESVLPDTSLVPDRVIMSLCLVEGIVKSCYVFYYSVHYGILCDYLGIEE